MRFCVATIEHWNQLGFDVTDWRKSEDGVYAILHYEYAKLLKPDLENDFDITVYEYQSEELESALVIGWGNEPANIDQLRLQMIKKVSDLCQYKIINEFHSACLGEDKSFDLEETDQRNILGLVAKAQLVATGSPLITNTSLQWKAKGEPICYDWTPEQVIKLANDMYEHIAGNRLKFESLREYINDPVRTQEEIKAVTWDTVIE